HGDVADARARGSARAHVEPYHALSGNDFARRVPRRSAVGPFRRTGRVHRARGGGDRRDGDPLPGVAAPQGDAFPMKKKPSSKISASRALVEDLVAGSRILAMYEVLDAYGHISARSDKRPDRFIMSRSRAPALVTAADLMELD